MTTLFPDRALDKIYAIPRLRHLELFIKRPNADDVADDAARILGQLEEQGARSQKFELAKAAKRPALIPNEETKRLAAVAAINGVRIRRWQR